MHRWEEIKNNKELQSKLLGAMEIRKLIREWFKENGFLEMETPICVKAAGQEPYLDPFETIVTNEKKEAVPAFLITSPEYSLKKILTAGFSKVFELARCFRNGEPQGGQHNPEFTMLEWYRADTDYLGIMEDTENLVFSVYTWLKKLGYKVQDKFDLNPSWERLTVREAFKKYADIELNDVFDAADFRKLLIDRGEQIRGDEDFDECYFKVFLSKIEPNLGKTKPVILYDYPASMAALAGIKESDPRYAERFEVYIGGLELANAFSELGDEKEQRTRFLEEQELRQKLGKTRIPLDESFLAALGGGFPKSGGIALGVDRLCMMLLDTNTINDVLFFPWQLI